jgi:hypothetical protein
MKSLFVIALRAALGGRAHRTDDVEEPSWDWWASVRTGLIFAGCVCGGAVILGTVLLAILGTVDNGSLYHLMRD